MTDTRQGNSSFDELNRDPNVENTHIQTHFGSESGTISRSLCEAFLVRMARKRKPQGLSFWCWVEVLGMGLGLWVLGYGVSGMGFQEVLKS